MDGPALKQSVLSLQDRELILLCKKETIFKKYSFEDFCQLVTNLIDKGANVNSVDDYSFSNVLRGLTPLHYLCFCNQEIDRIKFLLSKGANPNVGDREDRTPLHYVRTDYDLVELLLNSGADPRKKDSDGKTALELLPENADKRIVVALITAQEKKAKEEEVARQKLWGLEQALLGSGNKGELNAADRVFLNACKNNKNIHLALSLGADKYVTDPDNGWSGMHYACKNGNVDNVKFFLKDDTSANASVLDALRSAVFLGGGAQGKDLPMVIAHRNGYPRIVQLLADFSLLLPCRVVGAQIIPFSTFCVNVIGALKLGANIDCINEDENGDLFGFTPLLYLCLSGSSDKVKFLLKKKANPNKKSVLGFTPLYLLFAKKVGGEDESLRYSLARLLLKHGADVTIAGPEKRTVLQAAIDSGSTKSVEMLSKKINSLISSVSTAHLSKNSTDKQAKNSIDKNHKNKHNESVSATETKTKAEETEVPREQAPSVVLQKGEAALRGKTLAVEAEMQLGKVGVPRVEAPFARLQEEKSAAKKTYAAVVGDNSAQNVQTTQKEPIERNEIRIVDDHATITVPITQESQALMLLAIQNNPVAGLPLLKKVKKKKDKINDFFHNFSSRVEDQLGGFMRPKVLKQSTAEHCAINQYSINGIMTLHSNGKTFTGELQFVEEGNMITHRFFKPDKSLKKGSDKKSKKPLLLSSLSVDSKDALG